MFPKIGLYFFKNGSFYLSGNEIISFIYDDTPLLAMLTRVIALIIIYMSFNKIEYFCGIKKKALIFIGKRKKNIWSGVVFGCIIGLARIIVGGHFISDVYFSFVTVYLSALLLHYWMFINEYRKSEKSSNR